MVAKIGFFGGRLSFSRKFRRYHRVCLLKQHPGVVRPFVHGVILFFQPRVMIALPFFYQRINELEEQLKENGGRFAASQSWAKYKKYT